MTKPFDRLELRAVVAAEEMPRERIRPGGLVRRRGSGKIGFSLGETSATVPEERRTKPAEESVSNWSRQK
jgi:hypothetical protein